MEKKNLQFMNILRYNNKRWNAIQKSNTKGVTCKTNANDFKQIRQLKHKSDQKQ